MISFDSVSTRRITKKELIDAINKAFPDDDMYNDNQQVAISIEAVARERDFSVIDTVNNSYASQQIIFGKKLEF